MRQPTSTAQAAWLIVVAAARRAAQLEAAYEPAMFAACANGELRIAERDDPEAVVAWRPGSGWQPIVGADDARRGVLDLYLPICGATLARPIIVGHLGQSLDGFIATHTGDSHFVTGHANIVHLHRMRALCDAVIVGAGTVAADDPQLTTRHVEGPSPLRVIFDPGRRLTADYRVFTDDSAPTLYVCAESMIRPGETHIGLAEVMGLPAGTDGTDDVSALVRALRARGSGRIFVEGGGVTVSAFLEANLLDRLHMAIAPLLIGDGRPAIRLPGRAALSDCLRPKYSVFRMGGDVLFDCNLREDETPAGPSDDEPAVERII
jgi:diaminohydroxyphosphoribosylaminopyrimidine deaminase / 5-amino-6-(5-phosphoribosylamino)uracil reductase